jgi:hypothetical protein
MFCDDEAGAATRPDNSPARVIVGQNGLSLFSPNSACANAVMNAAKVGHSSVPTLPRFLRDFGRGGNF